MSNAPFLPIPDVSPTAEGRSARQSLVRGDYGRAAREARALQGQGDVSLEAGAIVQATRAGREQWAVGGLILGVVGTLLALFLTPVP